MQLLLDTHIYIWWLADDKRLSTKARNAIKEADRVYVSAVSLFECAIKIQLGKMKITIDELTREINANDFLALPLCAEQTKILSTMARHHGDPFDRMLIAQALSEPLHFLTADKSLAAYSELVLVA